MRPRHQHDDKFDEALDERGILKDGKAVRVSLFMRDGLSPVQQAVALSSVGVTDGQGETVGLHRPGFRISAADAERTSALDAAYRDHERALTTAWRGTASADAAAERSCADCDGSGHDDHRRCRTCGGSGVVSADYEDSTRRRIDSAGHRQTMSEVYGSYDQQLREAWRT
jgi:hypothetical protein